MKIRKIISIILVLIGMTVIFMFSNMNGEKSTNTSKSLIEVTEDDINQEMYKDDSLDAKMKEEKRLTSVMNKRIRKVAHFTEFCILAIVIVFAIESFGIKGYKAFIVAFFIILIYACSDELHQFFISGRDARDKDIIIDTLGGILGCIIYAAVSELYYDIKNKNVINK